MRDQGTEKFIKTALRIHETIDRITKVENDESIAVPNAGVRKKKRETCYARYVNSDAQKKTYVLSPNRQDSKIKKHSGRMFTRGSVERSAEGLRSDELELSQE